MKRRKILYIAKRMDVGGADRFVLSLARLFNMEYGTVTVASTGGIFENVLQQEGIKHIRLRQNPSPANIPGMYLELNALLKQEQYDIIHTHHRIYQFAVQLTMKATRKSIYTAHSIFNDYYQKLLKPDYLVCVSKSVYENCIATVNLSHKKILHINCIVDMKKTGRQPGGGQIVFAYIGRILKEKGIYHLLDAVEKLYPEGNQFSFIFRGKGETEDLQKKINERGLGKIVHLLPPETELEEIYKGIDAIVLPSSLNEGLPLSILEAAAAGILIISGKAGGTEDFLNNETGILLPEISADAIADAMRSVIKKDIDIEKVTGNALNKFIEGNYSPEEVFLKHKLLYEQLDGK